jgi:hypothetical protein
MDLTFPDAQPRYNSDRDVVSFSGEALGRPVRCAVSREALDDHFGADGQGKTGRRDSFQRHRSRIELMVKTKYLSWSVEQPDAVLLKSVDVEKLAAE